MSAPGPAPRFITFYSYKGGTGRSMALANVAWILASRGKRVLVLDWDLEAPGLHRYFHPFVRDKELVVSEGIIDFVMNFAAHAVIPASKKSEESAPEDAGWFRPHADILRYAFSLDHDFPPPGTLDMVPAGRQGPDYATRVNLFNWQSFYDDLGGGVFLEAARESARGYHYVLVDSRTGVSDTAGVCTVQLPDVLVVCFTLNIQSIEGAVAVAESAHQQRIKPDGQPGLRIFPIPTRVERAEAERLRAAKDFAAARFEPFLWHLAPEKRQSYWGRVEVLYHPYYAYEEVLATLADKPGDTGSMLSSMEALTDLLTDGEVKALGTIAEEERQKHLARYLRPKPAPAPAPVAEREQRVAAPPAPVVADATRLGPARPRGRSAGWYPAGSAEWPYWAYVSYARGDKGPYLTRFLGDLKDSLRALSGEKVELFFDASSIDLGENWQHAEREALARSRTALCLYSPSYFRSEHCGKEFALFSRRAWPSILPVLWMPVREIPPAAVEFQVAIPDVQPYEQGLSRLLRNSRFVDAYREIVQRLADRLFHLGLDAESPERGAPPFEVVENAFAPGAPRLDGSPPARRPRHALFLIAAPTAGEVVRDRAWLYGGSPTEWRPYGLRGIVTIVAAAAAAARITSEVAALGLDAIERLQKASDEGSTVIVLADPWTFRSEAHARVLADIGQRRFVNVFMMTLREDEDRETEVFRYEFEESWSKLSLLLGRQFMVVDSEAHLSRQLTTTLASAQLAALERAAPAQRSRPAEPGPVARPITGKGTT